MSDNKVFKLIELTGTSPTSIEEAVNTALTKASDSVRNMRWFEVVEVRGAIDENKVAQWQVTLKVGFAVED
jgi:flavin-binding protein dodecin